MTPPASATDPFIAGNRPDSLATALAGAAYRAMPDREDAVAASDISKASAAIFAAGPNPARGAIRMYGAAQCIPFQDVRHV